MRKIVDELILVYYYSHYMIRKRGKVSQGESNLGIANLTYALVTMHFFTLVLLIFRFVPIEILRSIFSSRTSMLICLGLIMYGVILMHELIFSKKNISKYEHLIESGQIQVPAIGGYYVVMAFILSLLGLSLGFAIGVGWR